MVVAVVWAALLAAALCALQTPLKLAVCVRVGEGARFALGVRPFAGNGALRAARSRLQRDGARPAKRRKRRAGRRPRIGLIAAIARRLLARVRVEALDARGELGLSDAAATALAVGGAHALMRAVGAATGARVTLDVRPRFDGRAIRCEASGIVSMRVGHIILAVCAGTVETIAGGATWKSIRSKTS